MSTLKFTAIKRSVCPYFLHIRFPFINFKSLSISIIFCTDKTAVEASQGEVRCEIAN